MRPITLAVGSAALIAACGPAAHAAEALKLSGSVRGRYEVIEDSARAVPLADESVLSLRSVLTAEYDAGALRFVGEIWDSRVYGAETGTVISANEVNVFEPVSAYVAADFDNAFGAGGRASVKAGRFTMDLGSRRMVANDDYRNTTNGFTGVRLDAQTESGTGFVAFYTLPQTRSPTDPDSVLDNEFELDRADSSLVFWGAAASRANLWPRTSVDGAILRFVEGDAEGRPTRDRHLTTLTARVIRAPAAARFDFEVEAGWQTGDISSGTQPNAAKLDVDATFLQARAAYTFTDPWKTRLAVEYGYASGDDGDAAYSRFDPLFGSRNGDYGPSGIYNTVGRANIASPAIRLEITPSKRLDAFAVLRPMWLTSRTDSFSTSGVRDAAGRSGNYAGAQFQGRVRYWVAPDRLRLEGNVVGLAKGRFLKTAPNAPASKADTKYLALSLMWTF